MRHSKSKMLAEGLTLRHNWRDIQTLPRRLIVGSIPTGMGTVKDETNKPISVHVFEALSQVCQDSLCLRDHYYVSRRFHSANMIC